MNNRTATDDANTRLALVVDDEPSSRLVLTALLNKHGFEVIQAEDGEEAITSFYEHHPDIIFMDVFMPVMDGYAAAAEIKSRMKDEFIPIIFITAATDEDALQKCVEAGGDDFLTKPYSDTILVSKISAMERIRALMSQTAALKNQMVNEEELAEKILTGAVTKQNANSECLRMIQLPAGLFSGDIILSSYTPANDLDILIGDFTGHGLTAAVGALPASEIFHAMSQKGFSGEQILEAINEKLSGILPTGMFMAVQFVRISHELDRIHVCNAGMPDILILDGKNGEIIHRATSRSVPLGVTSKVDLKPVFQILPMKLGDKVVLFSDGVIESRNSAGFEFGQTKLEALLQEQSQNNFSIDHAFTHIQEHNKDVIQDDDISLLEAICAPEMLPQWENETITNADEASQQAISEAISLSITYNGERLRECDPIPGIINFLKSSPALEEHRHALFTIFTELYVNALDHGVLGLSSELKKTPEGFAQYFMQREERIATLNDGFIKISVDVTPEERGGNIVIKLEDSGEGFNIKKVREQPQQTENVSLSGRGIHLIHDLCTSLDYEPPGNRVKAIYRWEN